MKDENYIVIQGFMRNQLGLKGNELMVYALIYGFCQDDEDEFAGSVSYIAGWIGATKQTVHTVLKSLVDKGLLHKREEYNNGVKFCRYKTLPVVKNFDEGVVKNFDGGGKKSLPNNIEDITNKHNSNVYKAVVEGYNYACKRLPKVERITYSRKKHIKARLNDFSMEQLAVAFNKANESDFLAGGNGRSWTADFDWLMKNSDNVTKVLEGKYDNKKQLSKTEAELMKAYSAIKGGNDDNRPYFGE